MPDVDSIVVIDSGFGGLGVVAHLDPVLPSDSPDAGIHEDIPTLQVSYVNAAPTDAVGFNQLPSYDAKVSTLREVLERAIRRSTPSGIYLACNTLSALQPDVQTAAKEVPLKGIAQVGEQLIIRFLQAYPDRSVLLLGTQTTVGTGLYPQRIAQLGEDPSRIVQVACPRLETLISNDPSGESVRRSILAFATEGLTQLGAVEHLGLFLGCTHYGYRESIFVDVLEELGVSVQVLNPNRAFAKQIADEIGVPYEAIRVKFVTRYVPPEGELTNIPRLLAPLSTASALAVQNYCLETD